MSPILIVWLAGLLTVGATLITGLIRVARISLRASRIDDPRWLEILDDVRGEYGLARVITIARTKPRSSRGVADHFA